MYWYIDLLANCVITLKTLLKWLNLSTVNNFLYLFTVNCFFRGDSDHYQRGPEDDEHRP